MGFTYRDGYNEALKETTEELITQFLRDLKAIKNGEDDIDIAIKGYENQLLILM